MLPHQLIDYTHGPRRHFFRWRRSRVVHVDFTHPYTPALRDQVPRGGAARRHSRSRDGGVYGAVSGPRLETAAEIDRLERDGVTLVGMTGMPEAALARELELPYAAIAVVVNHAAGRGDSSQEISMERIAARAGERRWTRFARCSSTWSPLWEHVMIRDVLRMGDPRLLAAVARR